MPHMVIQLGRWTDLSPELKPETYVCRVCRGAVSLGNTGLAESHPDGTWAYLHYSGQCADVPVKATKKRAGKNEHKG